MIRISSRTPQNSSVASSVYAQLLGQIEGAEKTVLPKHALVLIWGFIYVEGDDVYVQSYVRFTRRGVRDTVSLTLRTRDGGGVEMTGQVTDETIVFAPRKLSSENLNQIRHEFEREARIYSQPDESASHEPFAKESDRFRYVVTGATDGWLRIAATSNDDVRGWIRRGDTQLGDESLEKKMPEIAFIDAAVGYLRYRTVMDNVVPSDVSERHLGWAHSALSRYEESIQTNQERTGRPESPCATAMAHTMKGNLMLLAAYDETNIAAVSAAKAQYQRAVEAVPYNPDFINLHTITSAYIAEQRNWTDERPVTIATAMRKSLTLDPANAAILSNLENFYAYMQSLPAELTGVSQAQVQQTLQSVRRVRSSLQR